MHRADKQSKSESVKATRTKEEKEYKTELVNMDPFLIEYARKRALQIEKGEEERPITGTL